MSSIPPDPTPLDPNPYEPPKTGLSPIRQVGSAVGFVLASFGILVACLIAFVATCVPLGLVNGNSQGVVIAVVGGLVVAALTGFALARIMLKGRRRR